MQKLPCTGPISRRWFMQVGTLGLGGLSLADVLRMQAAAGQASAPPETSVIFVWLAGGPPHLDMYDMKPDAPAEYRGPFHPIPTQVSGLDVCDLMPLHAKCAGKYSVIRSIAHTFNDHGGGSKRVMTGRIPATPTETINDAPSVISIVARMRERYELGLPNCVACADGGREGVHTYAQGAAYLGPKYNPFGIGGDPNKPNFEIQNVTLRNDVAGRLGDRMNLLKSFDELRRQVETNGVVEAMDTFNQKAISIMTSPQAREAFDLSREPDSIRDRYGRNTWGQRALLARRLVEAGCSFVTCVLENPHLPDTFYNWDTHAVNHDNFIDMRRRLPLYDEVVTALIEDLHDRGLTKKVLLVVTGEFGRSPKISQFSGGAKGFRTGREHWPQAMSVVVSGGGMRHGQVIGSTNDKGEHPVDRSLTPNDLWATVYKHLGIDQNATITDYTGRPQLILPFGEPIRELV
ncbi:MAG: DUF1501 domain-containing protein [Planctomycetota bacterium]